MSNPCVLPNLNESIKILYIFQPRNERYNLKIEQNVKNDVGLLFASPLWNLKSVNRSGN